MPPAGFKPAIPENGQPQSHALDRAATGIGLYQYAEVKFGHSMSSEAITFPNVNPHQFLKIKHVRQHKAV
jgi:hypothetical protein